MFKFLKEKLKSAISKISENVEKEGKAAESIVGKLIEEPQKEEEKGFFAKIKEKFIGKEEPKEIIEEKLAIEEKVEVKKEEKPKIIRHEKIRPIKEEKTGYKLKIEEKIIEKEPEKKGFFDARETQSVSGRQKPQGFFSAIKEKITTTEIDEKQFEKLFWELEMALMESNVAVEVIEKIKGDLKAELTGVPLKRGEIQKSIENSLGKAVKDVLSIDSFSLIDKVRAKKPYVVCFVGINGSGKTTSIAKIAHLLQQHGFSVVLSASDTFRAASIEQLQHHGDKLGIRVIKHAYKSDPAAVAFDAISHAKSKHIDVVLIDTAGRMQSNTNLMDELRKVIRVAKPDLTLFVGESITGNDCIDQAKTFNDTIGIDGIILAKADIDEKGGAALSVSYVTQKPILYLGTGQEFDDLVPFKSDDIVKRLGLVQ